MFKIIQNLIIFYFFILRFHILPDSELKEDLNIRLLLNILFSHQFTMLFIYELRHLIADISNGTPSNSLVRSDIMLGK